jgi:hypothetical protein
MLKEGGVFLDKLLLVFRHVVESKHRVRLADRETGAAVDAFCGVDIHLGRGLKLGFILFGVNAIGGADVNAKSVFDAGVGDYVGHDESSLLDGIVKKSRLSVGTKKAGSRDVGHRPMCADPVRRATANAR